MTATYLPPITGSAARTGDSLLQEAVDAGPAYARSSRSTRWHVIRSAIDRIRPWDPDTITRTLFYFCGQMSGSAHSMQVDEVPEGEPTCGTCWGRREGVSADNPDLLFTPWALIAPKVCPGSHSDLYRDGAAWNRGVCLVCAEPVKLRSYGGWNSGGHGPQRHAPGDGVVSGCEFHGWRYLVKALDAEERIAVGCRCKTIEVRS